MRCWSATIPAWFAVVCVIAKSTVATATLQDSFIVTSEQENTKSNQSNRVESIRQLRRHSNGPGQKDIVIQPDLEQLTQEQEQDQHKSPPQLLSGSGDDNEQSDIIPVCQHVRLDFAKASNGRKMFGGLFVKGEWFHTYGVMIHAEGHNGEKDIHPMIFDSSNVETNGLEGSSDIFSLGSPNFDCGGFGVGRGGREGQPGENCQRLEKILMPSRVSGSPNTNTNTNTNTGIKIGSSEGASSEPLLGGVLMFEFHNKWTKVDSIELLNIMGEENEILAVHSNGTAEKINLVSVGQNGFQDKYLGLDNINRLYITLNSIAGVSGIDLCVVVDSA
jgi:hypothetical protein